MTISKIRFLESQGLVDPERTPSGYRKFYEPDIERLRWVLRQQRDAFLPLKVIKGRLDDNGEPVDGDEEAGDGGLRGGRRGAARRRERRGRAPPRPGAGRSGLAVLTTTVARERGPVAPKAKPEAPRPPARSGGPDGAPVRRRPALQRLWGAGRAQRRRPPPRPREPEPAAVPTSEVPRPAPRSDVRAPGRPKPLAPVGPAPHGPEGEARTGASGLGRTGHGVGRRPSRPRPQPVAQPETGPVGPGPGRPGPRGGRPVPRRARETSPGSTSRRCGTWSVSA